MHPRETTLSELIAARRRQDQDFRALCAALSALDPEQRFRLSEARAAEFQAAWETALPRGTASLPKVHTLRA